MYGAALQFLSNWRNIVIIALALVCVGLFIHGLALRSEIVSLKGTVAEQKGQLADDAKVLEEMKTAIADRDLQLKNKDTELNLAKATAERQQSGIAALQKEVKRLQDDSAYWWNMAKKKDKIISDLKSTEAAELVKKGKVIDENSSVKVIEELNATVLGPAPRPAAGPGL